MELMCPLMCPCGNGELIRRVTTKGPNIGRAYYVCPGTDERNNIENCKFYSFQDELRYCPCGRGLCRNTFVKREKFWSCCVEGAGSCSFLMKVMSTCEAASSSTRSPTNPLVVPQTSPPPLSTQASTSTPSTNSSALPQSSPPSSQVAVMRKTELLVEALEVAQSMSATYLNIIKKFADCELNARESNDTLPN